jgi:hypothetical protein
VIVVVEEPLTAEEGAARWPAGTGTGWHGTADHDQRRLPRRAIPLCQSDRGDRTGGALTLTYADVRRSQRGAHVSTFWSTSTFYVQDTVTLPSGQYR